MDFCKEPYQAEIDKPTILPTSAEYIWEKFEYFDKMSHGYPNCDTYEKKKQELLALWWEQFQKEVRSNETTE